MKKMLILGLLLPVAPAFAAIDCAVLPTCAELGYTDKISVCPNDYTICPFDRAMGKCIMEAQAGDIKYSIRSSNHAGWLLCNGSTYDRYQYPELYTALSSTFGTKLPDYRGYFLRVSGTPSSSYGGSGNTSLTTPQKEQLPNITGSFWKVDDMTASTSGAFSSVWVGGYDADSGNGGDGRQINFSAASSNSIYSGSHVIPANMAVYAYIYTGRLGYNYDDAYACNLGDYFYSDSTCSSSYNSAKTVLGIAAGVSKSTTTVTINLTWGGNTTVSSSSSASTACTAQGGSVEIQSYFSKIPASVSNSVVVAPSSSRCYWSNGSKVTSSGATCTASSPYYYCYRTLSIKKPS